MCLIPISSVLALLFPAAGSGGGFLCGVGCGGERGRGDETDVVVGGSQSTTKFTVIIMLISTSDHVQWLIVMVMAFIFQWFEIMGYSMTVNHKYSVCYIAGWKSKT